MRGTAIEQPDPFPYGGVALHFLAAFRALVQLLPAAFSRLVVSHRVLALGGNNVQCSMFNVQRSKPNVALIVIHRYFTAR